MNWVEVCHSSLPTKKSHKRSPLKRPLFWLEVGSPCFGGWKKSKRGDKQVAGTRMYNIILYIYGIHRTCMMNVQNHHSLFLLYFLLLSPHGPQSPAIHFQVKFLDHLSSTTSKTQGLHRRSVEMSRWPGNNPALVRRLGRGAGWYRFHFFVKSLGVRRWRLSKKEAGSTWRIIPLGGILFFFNHGDRFSPKTMGLWEMAPFHGV